MQQTALNRISLVNIFGSGPNGGNPAPIVLDATGMSTEEMRLIAAGYGHESAFVFPGQQDSDFQFRFFVPNHEMEMCGHATLGTVWLLNERHLLTSEDIRISTLSGIVHARLKNGRISISQPKGSRQIVSDPSEIFEALRLRPADMLDLPIVNAATSRVKTLVPVKSLEILNSIQPDFTRITAVCDSIGSTGLYPFAVVDKDAAILSARQFPRSSGYPEDAATGIAATALVSSLEDYGFAPRPLVTVRQGEAMGRPSEIAVTFEDGRYWLSGKVELVNGEGT